MPENTILLAELTPQQWAVGLLGGLLVGLGKGGLSGVGNFTIALYALSFPARASVGLLLPVLIIADVVAIILYRRTVDWRIILRLLPWAVIGILIGTIFLSRAGDQSVRVVIGGTVLFMAGIYFARKILGGNEEREISTPLRSSPFMISTGVAGGFASMVANAAGPVAALYLLAAGLKKYVFVGTMAWFFFLVNWIKLPLQGSLGIVNLPSLTVSAIFGLAAVVGVFLARRLIKHIPQKAYERLIWTLIVLAGLRLLF